MLFKPMFKAGCCGRAVQAAPKPSRGLWADRGGVTSVEYALLASLLALAVLTGGATAGTALQKAFLRRRNPWSRPPRITHTARRLAAKLRKETSPRTTASLDARRSDAWNAIAAAQGSANRAT